MRQRRHVLQVSTFPFLAVLLCAMGSLILLLLVIDRRAKAVARAKALEAAARMEKEEQRAASTRLAESEKQEQARRADMQNQKMQLEKQIQQIDTETCTAGQELSTEQCRAADLQNGIREESTRVAQKQAENQHRTGKVGQMQAKARETSQELSDLSANLLQLEQTMAKIKTAKQQEPQVYSVVPYLGRRGANRRPFYVECTDTALVFHPDRRTLEGADMTREKIRTEVENRVAKLRARGNAQEETPYLLMLVRPGGISSYYRAMTALDGLKVDFGYELIEADWILDFPEKDKPPVQPWMVTEKPPDNRPPLPLPASKSLSANSDSIKPIGSGQAMTSGDAKAQVQRGDGIQEPMQTGNNTPVSLPGGISNRPLGGAPANSQNMPGVIAQSGPLPGEAASPTTSLSGSTQQEKSTGLPIANLSQIPVSAGQEGTGPGQEFSPPPSPPGNRLKSQRLKSDSAAGSGGSPNNPEESTPGLLRFNPVPPNASDKSPPVAPSGSKQSFGTREWTIPIECTQDAIVIYPGPKKIPAAILARADPKDNPLFKTVQDMIDRRQALVRPGEPGYQAKIRFLVRPDGLRSYYLAYPILESLQVPMTRENLLQGDP